jgi:hypothetical protein
MPTLDVDLDGTITLTPELLNHLGVSPGQDVKVSRFPNGTLSLGAARTHQKAGDEGDGSTSRKPGR